MISRCSRAAACCSASTRCRQPGGGGREEQEGGVQGVGEGRPTHEATRPFLVPAVGRPSPPVCRRHAPRCCAASAVPPSHWLPSEVSRVTSSWHAAGVGRAPQANGCGVGGGSGNKRAAMPLRWPVAADGGMTAVSPPRADSELGPRP